MKVLIAEDEESNRRLLELMLVRWGYEVQSASDGLEAWRLLDSPDAPQLVLLDWVMPGMDGLELCRRVRERQGSRLIYIVMVTARGRREDIIAGLEAGADDYITRPFDREELRARVQVGVRMLELQRSLAEHEHQLAVARTLMLERQRFDAAVSRMSDGILVVDEGSRIVNANHAATLLLDMPDPLPPGATLESVLTPFSVSVPLVELRGGRDPLTTLQIAREETHPPLYLDARFTRLADSSGRFTGGVLTVRDVTEERYTQNLRANFFRMVSHKLSTPLTVLSAYLQLFKRLPPERSVEKWWHVLEVFAAETARLEEVVRQLLEFKTLSSVELQSESQYTAVGPVIQAVWETVRQRYAERATVLELVVDPDAAFADAGAAHMALVMDKLLDNAVKFGSQEPVRVTVEVQREEPAWIRVSVTDNGPGIPHEYYDRIFEGFLQIEDHVTGQVPGLGIGLVLARHVVEAYGGSISLHSRLGQGSTFSFTLPEASRTRTQDIKLPSFA